MEEEVQKKDQNIQGYIPLKPDERDSIKLFLQELDTSKKAICEGMILAMEYASNASDIVHLISSEISDHINSRKDQVEIKKISSLLYLINDILFNTSNNTVTSAWTYRQEFETELGQIYEDLNQLWTVFVQGRMSQKSIKKLGMRLLKIWREGALFEERLIDGWESTLKRNKLNFYALNLKESQFQP